MNERIEQLALECYHSPEFDYKKFAELIVRECARVAGTTDYLDGDEYNSGRFWAGAEVLEHFGIEE